MRRSILYDLKIQIVTGGFSAEREANLHCARNVEKALIANGVHPDFLILDDKIDKIWPQIQKIDADFVFALVTEEVPVQVILDMLNIPYNGSSNLQTALSLHKQFIKQILSLNDIHVPRGVVVHKNDLENLKEITYPAVVKPLGCGDSKGVSLIRQKSKLKNALHDAFKYDSQVIVEEIIEGQEITIPVLGNFVMPGVKVTSSSGIWDELRKDNLDVSFEVVHRNTPLDKQICKEMLKIKQIFGFENIWRADTILKANKLYILEINTQPVLASGKKGLLATSCNELGWDHFDLLTRIAEESLSRKKH